MILQNKENWAFWKTGNNDFVPGLLFVPNNW